jgi:hypothetical protein
MKNSVVSSINQRLKSAQVALEGFPWRLAIVLYTLSWGWSLLRPNTLYWDDWAFIYGQPKSYLNEIFVDTGLPPWRALIDQELIAFGYWTIPLLTFIMFFASGIFVFRILKSIGSISSFQRRIIVLSFLLLPVNSSRIALVLFGYSTSYFLFFLAWCLVIVGRKNVAFIAGVIFFFWSFMTHSFLFFYLLPVIHFLLKRLSEPKNLDQRKAFVIQVCILVSLPFVYYLLRSQYWAPKPEWEGYHQFILRDALKCVGLFVIGLVFFVGFLALLRKHRTDIQPTVLTISGWLIFSLGLFPYFANGRIPDYVSIIAFRSDWGGRHLMLTPLGISLMIGGIAEMFNGRFKLILVRAILSTCVVINLFFSSQFYLDSLKKSELTSLFIAAIDSPDLNETSKVVFVDETKMFNGRFSTYRDPELRGKLEIANLKVASITGKVTCEELLDGVEMKIRTKKSYFAALISRDLGLYSEIKKC